MVQSALINLEPSSWGYDGRRKEPNHLKILVSYHDNDNDMISDHLIIEELQPSHDNDNDNDFTEIQR